MLMQGQVIAVEPMPLIFRALKANVDSMARAAEARSNSGKQCLQK